MQVLEKYNHKLLLKFVCFENTELAKNLMLLVSKSSQNQ